MCFNSFYQTPNVDITEWNDLNVRKELQNLSAGGCQYHTSEDADDVRKFHQFTYTNLWDTIDPIRFYKKDQPDNTFKRVMEKANVEPVYYGWHPSPESHKVWAEELKNYIETNNLL